MNQNRLSSLWVPQKKGNQPCSHHIHPPLGVRLQTPSEGPAPAWGTPQDQRAEKSLGGWGQWPGCHTHTCPVPAPHPNSTLGCLPPLSPAPTHALSVTKTKVATGMSPGTIVCSHHPHGGPRGAGDSNQVTPHGLLNRWPLVSGPRSLFAGGGGGSRRRHTSRNTPNQPAGHCSDTLCRLS